MRRGDELIAAAAVLLLPEVLEDLPDDRAVRVPEDQTRARGFLHAEQVEGGPQLAVIALLGLVEEPQVFLELVLRREGGAVDPLQLLVLFRSLPVGPRHRQELEGADRAGGRQVRAGAEIHEVALPIARDDGAALLGNQLDLQVVSQLPEVGQGLLLRLLDPADRVVRLLDLAHASLDPLEVFGRERLRPLEIVEEALFGRRADADLHLREQILDRVGQQMRGGVPVDLQRPGRFGGDELQPAALLQRQVDVLLDSIHHRRDGPAGEGGVEGLGDGGQRRRAREGADGPAGQDGFHCFQGALSLQS